MFNFSAGFDPYAGFAPNLIPTPPAEIPAPVQVGSYASDDNYPFNKPQDVDSIIQNITIERPLPLYIPPELKHTQMEYHIVNNKPEEIAAAMRRHWQVVDKQELVSLFEGKVSGSDKDGRIMRPVLMARDRRIGLAEAKLKAQKLAEHNAGLDPKNKQFNSKYVDPQLTVNSGDTKGQFGGFGLGRIRGR